MTDTARDHLERAVAWLHEHAGGVTLPRTRMAAALVEVKHALELLDAIPPRDPTEEMLRSGMRELNHNWLRSPPSDLWRAMYDAALAEREGK